MKKLKSYSSKFVRLIKRLKRNIIHAYKCMTYPYYEYTDLDTASKEIPDMVQLLPFVTLSSFYKLPTYYSEDETHTKDGDEVTIQRAMIHSAKCFIYSDLILLSNGKVINELKNISYYRDKIDFTDEIILRDDNTRCQLLYTPEYMTIKIPTAIKIGGMFGFNYYHFVYQLLTRMNHTMDIDSSIPLLLDASARDIPTMKQLVEYTNIHNREVVYMDYGFCYEVENLYYITSSNVIAPNIKSKRFDLGQMAFFTSCSLEYLRSILLPFKANIQTPEYVFIARRKATKRRGYNEQECGDILKDLGFVEVYPETLTLAEQMTVFNNAKIIVGATGAAFTNLIFCSNKTNIVILSNYKVGFPYFSSIASFVGSRLIYLYDKKLGEVPNYKTSYAHEAFHVDVKDLKELVSKIITK